jgi:DNA-binding protein H-NS
MSKLEQLLAERAAMDQKIEAEIDKNREEALTTVRSLCKQYAITLREIKASVLQRKPRVGKEKVVSKKKVTVRKTAAKRPPSTKN